jgi:hypothetical protein
VADRRIAEGRKKILGGEREPGGKVSRRRLKASV